MTSTCSNENSHSDFSDIDDNDIPDDKEVFYEEYVNVLKQSYTNNRFYDKAINEIDQLRIAANLQPRDITQFIIQGILLLPLQLYPPKPIEIHMTEVLKKYAFLVGHYNKWKDSASSYDSGVREAVDTLVRRGVISSKEAALDVLAIISHETSLSFRHLEIEIKNGIYDQTMAELQSARVRLNLAPDERLFQGTTSKHVSASSKRKTAGGYCDNSVTSSTRPQQQDEDVSLNWEVIQERNHAVDRQLSKKGLCSIDVKGDGNCFFRALSVTMNGHEEDHPALRQVVAKHMASDASNSHMLIRGASVDEVLRHADEAAVEGVWVGEDVIMAAAKYLRRPIHVFIAVDSCSPLVYGAPCEPGLQPLLVAFREPGHYNAVKHK